MQLFVSLHRRWSWLNYPGALLLVLLQRTPALRLLAQAEAWFAAAPSGALLRSAFTAGATLGAVHALAGATQYQQSPANPVRGTVGQTVSVGFTITGSPLPPNQYFIDGTLPPGLSTMPAMDPGSNRVPSGSVVITGVPTQGGTYTVSVTGSDGAFSQTDTIVFEIAGPAASAPVITAQPAPQAVNVGGSATFSVAADGSPSFQWRKNGVAISGATGSTFTVNNVQPADAGVYSVVATNATGSATSNFAVLGIKSDVKLIGPGTEVLSNTVVSNRTFDQILLEGAAATVRADPGQILRISFIDLTKDIVQVEFSGAGAVTVTLDAVSGPAAPENYNQSVQYRKGHPSLVVTDADATTNMTVFSVGRINAVNQALFRDDVTYNGFADVGFIAITSRDGQFGFLRTANVNYFATNGITGIYAPGVKFNDVVFASDITASADAQPVLMLNSDSATAVRVTGGDLEQTNGKAVRVGSFPKLNFADGSTSHGTLFPAQANKAKLERDGVDVTQQLTAP